MIKDKAMIENVRELRIGNIVSYYSSERKESVPFYVEQIFVDEVEIENGEEGFRIMVDRLYGIPLTDELLLKCGFKREHCGFSNDYIELSYGRFLCGIGKDYDDVLFVSLNCAEYPVSDEVRHLHQLQNIYYALTGKELEVEL